ncbi:SpvB/TcaC N-terminal domain-containing protein [Flavivirga abyssicola]|uniref:SpvB/TcaC N-terminal domain-containing protein n=1 Tax=Flavivirga abyssicola TaxID=3063533 RepID=UPI0026E02311|nr:SpvB/TcaC N-terminal domain-containing protein [Flavivirga sp. MEBiC07777]WVK12283.1 SpvB/TcaC N-terminal domain-containing protein [Flavivirga sp. MEBiC07777]
MENNLEERNTGKQNSTPNNVDLLSKENPTQSNAIEIPSISLPKGGGALKGIDEKFEVNPSNGTAGFSIPFPVSPGRNGFSPSINLSYNSGVGNSIFGIGWSIGLPSIKRKTDKELPKYQDTNSSEDTFVFSGIEDLVPFLEEGGTEAWKIKEYVDNGYKIKRYRPRIESGFSRIEKISHPDHGIYWKVTSGNNQVTFYGKSNNYKISNPIDEERIYEWLPEFSYDNKGNYTYYEYKTENLDNVPDTIYNKNRTSGLAPFTNRYLKRIKYGNQKPYYPDTEMPYDFEKPIDDLCAFELVLDYGEHDEDQPTLEEINTQKWKYRSDAFSSYRSGFEIRTNRLCNRVLMFHTFPELNAGTPTLVRSLDFEYLSSEALKEKTDRPAELTYLVSIVQKGYILKPDNTYSVKALPKMTFDYQWLNWNTETKTVSEDNLVNAPVGVSGNYQWVDLYSEGINGILTEQANALFYKSNLGEDKQGHVHFSQAKSIIPKPAFLGITEGILQLQDLEANGQKQVVVNAPGQQGYFELNDEEEWQPFKTFLKELRIDVRNPNVRMLDLNGDGRPDVVLSDQGAFTWWGNKGKIGYDNAELVPKSYNEESGPAIVFQDQKQSIFLADMTGDGLTDIVRIINGEICYWANMGYGRFSAKVTMENAPWFDAPELFNPQYLNLADISGTGVTDIIYLGKNKFSAYLNFSGNAWSDATFIDPFFSTEKPNKITVTDLLGNGTSCMVWSSELPGYKHAPMRYIDLMGGIKPHIMKSYENGFGKKVEVEYRSSTSYYLEDKRNGTPWITKLPFPVQCVSKSIITEEITKVRFATKYSYHHGYYDHGEREFRGFGSVEQLDSEYFEVFEKTGASNVVTKEHHQPPVLTKTWFHTGAFLDKKKILTQFKKEYWYEIFKEKGFDVEPIEYELPDATLSVAENITNLDVDSLEVEECIEALRACKGMVLRRETFALDAEDENDLEQIKKQLTPYNVTTHNCDIQLLQQKHQNKHAVYIVRESEAITYAYERNPEDPRIAHKLNIEIDEYGNIVESASVVYPRIQTEDLLKDAPTDSVAARNAKQHARNEQQKRWITYSVNDFTNDITTPQNYLLRKGWQNKTYEVTGMTPAEDIFTIDDFKNSLNSLPEIEYQKKPEEGIVQKRLIEHIKTKYYNDTLSAPLLDGQLGVFGVNYENYQLAYTPNLLQSIYTPTDYSQEFEVTESDMLEAKYYQEDTNWWVRSGTIQFFNIGETFEDIKERFLNPISYTNPFGTKTEVFYDPLFIFVNRTLDPLGNESQVLEFNYRTLSPTKMRDFNDNIASVIMNELGFVKAGAIEGKDTNNDKIGEEADNLIGIAEIADNAEQSLIDSFFEIAQVHDVCNYAELQSVAKDLLKSASSCMIYNFNQKPTVAASIIREQHALENLDSPIQISFEYSDGLGNVAMTKVQAEPGIAKKAIQLDNEEWDIEEVDTVNQLRWIGNGRTVLNNKGNPIKQYEPYFSVSPMHEDAAGLVETGVTPIIYYDAVGRSIKTEFPNGTFTKVEFDAWKYNSYDANDTVKNSDWYVARMTLADTNAEKKAALKTETHHETPSCVILDTLGRLVLTIDKNKYPNASDQIIEEQYYTYVDIDIEGNAHAIIDARGNIVMEYQYDLLGHRVAQKSMDAGKRWMFNNVLGSPVKLWDEHKHEFHYTYDILQRPLDKWARGGEGTVPMQVLYRKIVYGEGLPNDKQNNLRGNIAQTYDTAGKVISESYDFKGNRLASTRIFAQEYKNIPNWDVPNPDDLLEGAAYTFTSSAEYDALNRPVKQIQPDGSEHIPFFNAARFLERVDVKKGTSTNTYVQNINYDAKGQRTEITYGNDTKTDYTYDPDTFRLTTLKTSKKEGEPLQDLKYTYDPIGNIVEIKDQAIPTVFYNNQKITGRNEYTYDALYRLIVANGREQSTNMADFAAGDNWGDSHAKFNLATNDPMAMHGYVQRYRYDTVGNILQTKHIAGAHSWTRDYVYETKNNRIKSTEVGEYTLNYEHHPIHGYITKIPHLPLMQWNFKEELAATSKQVRTDGGTPETTYYVYDGSGRRVRKVTENAADEGNTPSLKNERIYLGNYEVYRDQNGLERETLHIMDDQTRIAMIDTETEPRMFLGLPVGRTTPVQTVRYNLSNHLGSSTLELDEHANVISYEEYHPFGTTAYQAQNSAIKAAAKRYRYTGMERDEETGLEYHKARYYIPWLGRWLNSDPLGMIDGANLYKYGRNNPIKLVDINGTESIDLGLYEVVEDMPESFFSFTGNRGDLEAVRHAIDEADEIRFHLDDIDEDRLLRQVENIADAVEEFGDDIDELERFLQRTDSFTAYEFYEVVGDQEVLDKVEFFEGGSRVPQERIDNLKSNFGDLVGDGGPRATRRSGGPGGGDGPGGGGSNGDGGGTRGGGTPGGDGSPPRGNGPGGSHASARATAPDAPDVPRTRVRTPGRAPKVKGGIIIGALIAGVVLLATGDVYAAGQSVNPAAETTDAVVEGGDAGDVALGILSDIWYATPPGMIHGLGNLNQAAMDASHFPAPEGWVEQQVEQGRNPFCALCHGPNAPARQQPGETSLFTDFDTFQTETDREALEAFVRSLESR